MIGFKFRGARVGATVFGVTLLAACAAKAPPPPPPPPPPPVEIVPYRPLPPLGATYTMRIPGLGADGRHVTVLSNLSDDQRVWYFRSAWNVAALNCVGPEHQPILDGYKTFLIDNAKALKAVNSRLEATFVKAYPSRSAAIAARETAMTMVYNYFALPPARVAFCQAGMQVASLAAATPKPTVAALANNFALWEAPFESFFVAYDEYQRDAAIWDARYGERYGASQPGYLAVQAARASSFPRTGTSGPGSTSTLTLPPAVSIVTDPDTGAKIPVIPVTAQPQGIPVVQPVPQSTPKPPAKP